MDDLNKPLVLDNEYSPKKNKNSEHGNQSGVT